MRQMLPASFRTYRAAPKLAGTRGDQAVVARALRPLRVRVRPLDAATVFGFVEADLFGLAAGDVPTASGYAVPVLETADFMCAPGDTLYAVSGGTPFRVSVHRAEILGLLRGEEPKFTLHSTTVRVSQNNNPRPIARAPSAAPIRVTVRNLSTNGFAGGAFSIAVSDSIADLIAGGSASAYIIPSLAGLAQDVFILAPGQVLYAVALGPNDVPVSVLTHQGLSDGTFVQVG